MNQAAIDQFKGQVNNLISMLQTFLKWVNAVEAQEKVYEDKMKLIASQNKQVEGNRDTVQKKEQELLKREAELGEVDRLNRKKQEELLLKEGNLLKEREQMVSSKTDFEKKQKLFAQERLKEDILINMKNQVLEKEGKLKEKEALLEAKEKLNDERATKLEAREKQLKQREVYLDNLLK